MRLPSIAGPRSPLTRGGVAALVTLLGAASGCTGGDDAAAPAPPRLEAVGAGDPPPSDDGGPCEEGAERACGELLAVQGRVVTCREGTERCTGGTWTGCLGDALTAFALPVDAAGLGARALGEPEPCASNVCDPACRAYYEQPAVAIETARGTPIFTWTGGSVDDLRAKGLVAKAFVEPCSSAYDCQFNHHCVGPATEPDCAHGKCDPGAALDPGCEDALLGGSDAGEQTCVGMICAARPSCCARAYDGDCARDPCAAGTPLKADCDTRVAEVCAELPDCCGAAAAGADPLVREAERHSRHVPRSSQHFREVTEATASSGAVMQAWPDNGKAYAASKRLSSPALEFDVELPVSGRYYAWVRGRAGGATVATSDSVHVGLDGEIPASGEALAGFTAAQGWVGRTMAMGAPRAYLDVPTAGPHTIDLWMREDGFVADKLLLTRDAGYTPNGEGPDGGAPGAWSPDCAARYAERSADACNARSWDETCVAMVDAVCGAKCAERPDATCEHSPCDEDGVALDARCHPCVARICAAIPSCCITGWSGACRDQVASACELTCPIELELPAPEPGVCAPWLPGQTNEACDGIDLGVGVPCSGTLPICNHGTATAEAGIRVIHYPANSGQYPDAAPDQDHPQLRDCFTAEPIPPGHCVGVTTCELNGNREIMVNPPDPGAPAECSRLDNWGLFSGDAECKVPLCSEADATASFRGVNLYLMLDKSASMRGARWAGTVAALEAFFAAPESDGLAVALELFPLDDRGAHGDGCGDPSVGECDAAPCADPMVSLETLGPGARDPQEKRLVDAIESVSPGGYTPTYPALRGAVDALIAAQRGDPDDLYAVVLATDGEPTKCEQSTLEIAKVALDGYAAHGIRTYTIGMDGADLDALDTIAHAGGTRGAFVVTDDASVDRDLLDALFSISREMVRCDFAIENGEYLDPTAATVTYVPGAGGEAEPLPRRDGPGGCGEGWYFDDPRDPTRATLCPDTCAAVQADGSAQISVRIGCSMPYEAMSLRETYVASCPPNQGIQWAFFGWVAAVESGAEIVFSARAAPAESELADAEWVELGRATAELPACGPGGPLPDCPRNVFDRLGVRAQDPYVELEAALIPSPSAAGRAALEEWLLSYTCVDDR